MLEQTYEVVNNRFNDQYEAWDHFIELLIADHNLSFLYELKDNLRWLFEEKSTLMNKIKETYDPKLLSSDYYDHLGEMYLEKIVSKSHAQKRGQFLTPAGVAETMAKMTIPKSDKMVNVLDPCVGSGRLLMAAYKQVPKARLFGVDLDLRMIRIAMANFAIHNIKGYLLHANSLEHEINISKPEGSYNWQFSNKWYSNIDQLKKINTESNYSLNLQYPENNDK